MALLKKLGYKDMGFIPSRESRVFGKWITSATEAEIAQATNSAEINQKSQNAVNKKFKIENEIKI
ncbi:MAG: hypothetical protein ACLR2E_07970 [Lachnospiraceae bacterium]